jgi:choline dehydrogenase-like flavoprotein
LTRADEADVAVVGAGFAGLLVARELASQHRRVVIVERGGYLPHAVQVRSGRHEVRGPTTEHTHEHAPDVEPYRWDYIFGVGGGSLHWTGAAPRLLPSDFRLRSEYGVGRDWPLTYEELEPYYVDAERLLHVAGADSEVFPRSVSPPQPAHPLSPADRLLAEALPPVEPLPQARPTRAVGARPPCCASTFCSLCPVDARMSMLHVLDDERLLEQPGLGLRTEQVVARVAIEAGRAAGVVCLDAHGEEHLLRATTVVLAAGGLENPAILLRSGLDDEHTGRYLFDHGHRLVHLELDRAFGAGVGASHTTGISLAHADGSFRAREGSQVVLPLNGGSLVRMDVQSAVLERRFGTSERAKLRDRVQRTLVLDVLGEDLPQAGRAVALSSSRDALGLPRLRLRYPGDSPYLEAARRRLVGDLERLFAPLGGRITAVQRSAEGAHQLGTCFMGERDGVVDRDLRHHRVEGLHVVGGSAFPAYSALHPTLTICALALRLGRRLAAELQV